MKITPLDPWIRQKICIRQPELIRQEIESWQVQKINETLALVRASSSFYCKHLTGTPASISRLEEISKFPFTTPRDIRANPLHFMCVSQNEIERVVTLQTSGTTGMPKRLYFTADDQELTIDFFKVGMSTLTNRGERVLVLLPGETPGSVGDLLRIGLLRLGAETIPYGPMHDPFQTLEVMQTQRVNCLVGSPTQVLGLARRWGSTKGKPHSVLLSTDYVPSAIVKTLNEIWDCEVFDHYGATEMGLGGGVECSAHLGYHLREADLFFEVIDPITGARVPDGEYGEVVFTTLTRHGMPLIRYRTGDRSRFIPYKCLCETALKTLEKVRGRFDGFLTVGDTILSLPEFDEALFTVSGLLNFSLIIKGERGKELLLINAEMMDGRDSINSIEQALQVIPDINRLNISIQHQTSPAGISRLSKRVIIDERNRCK